MSKTPPFHTGQSSHPSPAVPPAPFTRRHRSHTCMHTQAAACLFPCQGLQVFPHAMHRAPHASIGLAWRTHAWLSPSTPLTCTSVCRASTQSCTRACLSLCCVQGKYAKLYTNLHLWVRGVTHLVTVGPKGHKPQQRARLELKGFAFMERLQDWEHLDRMGRPIPHLYNLGRYWVGNG